MEKKTMKRILTTGLTLALAASVQASPCTGIKGLIHLRDPNLRYYLTPQHALYPKIQNLAEDRGETCFRTEAEAQAAGFFQLPDPDRPLAATGAAPKPKKAPGAQPDTFPGAEWVQADVTRLRQELLQQYRIGARTVMADTEKFEGRVSYTIPFVLNDVIAVVDQADLAALAQALQTGGQVNDGQGGGTALMLAAYEGNRDAVGLLLDAGADPNIQEPAQQITALMLAASEGHTDVVTLLLDHQADPNLTNRYGANALMFAVADDAYDLGKLLVERGTGVKNAAGAQILEYAMQDMFQAGDELAQVMQTRGATLPSPSTTSAQAAPPTSGRSDNPADAGMELIEASQTGDLDRVRQLVQAGADVNANPLGIGVVPLIAAATEGHAEIVALLLEHDANPNSAGPGNMSALSAAIAAKHLQIAGQLLQCGADPNTQDQMAGFAPLHYAVMAEDAGLVQLLIEKGANVNAANNDGATPLMMADAIKHEKIITLLKKAGAK